MGGRRPKPIKLKILAGNPDGRKLNKNEPEPTSIAICPDWLSGDAKDEWIRVAAELGAIGLLSGLDQTALSAYCQAYKRWRHAERRIEVGGLVVSAPSGYLIQNPWVSISNTAIDQMRKFLVEFGMSPAARSKVNATPKEVDGSLEDFLSGRYTRRNGTNDGLD